MMRAEYLKAQPRLPLIGVLPAVGPEADSAEVPLSTKRSQPVSFIHFIQFCVLTVLCIRTKLSLLKHGLLNQTFRFFSKFIFAEVFKNYKY